MAKLPTKEVDILPRRFPGSLVVPRAATGVVVFAHGSGSSRLSPRNRYVATALNENGLATLLFDLLLPEEADDRNNVFDIPLLGSRVEETLSWMRSEPAVAHLSVGLFGASTGAAAEMQSFTPLTSKLSSRKGALARKGRGASAATISGKSNGIFPGFASYRLSMRGMYRSLAHPFRFPP